MYCQWNQNTRNEEQELKTGQNFEKLATEPKRKQRTKLEK